MTNPHRLYHLWMYQINRPALHQKLAALVLNALLALCGAGTYVADCSRYKLAQLLQLPQLRQILKAFAHRQVMKAFLVCIRHGFNAKLFSLQNRADNPLRLPLLHMGGAIAD